MNAKSEYSRYFGIEARPEFFGLSLAFCLTYSIQRIAPSTADSLFHVALFFGVSVSCLAFFLAAKLLKRNISSQGALCVVYPLLGVTCVLLLVVPSPLLEHPWVPLALSFLLGTFVGWQYLLWGSFYCRLATKAAIAVLFGSTILAAFFKVIIMLFESGVPVALVCATLPMIATVLWRRASRTVTDDSGLPQANRFTPKTLYVFTSMIAGVVAFTLALGVVRSLDMGYFAQPLLFEVLTQIITIAVSFGILAVIYKKREDFEFSNVWFIALLTISSGLLVSDLFGGAWSALSFSLLIAAQMFVLVFLWLALSDIAHNSSFDSDVVFGVGWVLYSLPVALGSLGTRYLDIRLSNASLSLIVIYVLLVATLLFVTRRAPRELRLLADLNPTLSADGVNTLMQQVDALALHYTLSAREKEVVFLYVQGRNRAFISSSLFISESTVRDHIQSTYKKLSIHSKQELIDKLQSF